MMLERLPVESIYKQELPNQAIAFGRHRVRISSSKTKDVSSIDPVDVDISLQFAPDPRLRIVAPPSSSSFADLFDCDFDSRYQCEFLDLGTQIDLLHDATTSKGVVYSPQREPALVRSKSDFIVRAVFHLANMPDFRGGDSFGLRTGTAPHYGGKTCGRVILRADGWIIDIVAAEDSCERIKSLKEVGGYVITHHGEIRKEDNTVFSSQELEDILATVHYFLAFALGRWCGPSLVVAFDESDAPIYEEWGLREVSRDAWRGSFSWFDKHHAELLSQVFPGFVLLSKKEPWQHSLRDVIYWYVSANRVGHGVNIDSALLFTQSALELLAWTCCVQDRKMVSRDAFSQRGLSAANKLRLLASSLSIPISHALELDGFKVSKGKKPWDDAMHAVTSLRNGLVHPDSDRTADGTAYYDAWRFSHWLIEMVILRLCGHVGRYGNRLSKRFTGTVEPVPWATTSS